MAVGPDVKIDWGPSLILNSVVVYRGIKFISKNLNYIFFQSLFIFFSLIVLSLGQQIYCYNIVPDKPLQNQEEIKITNTELAKKTTTRDCPNGATVSADIAGRQ